MRVIFAGTPVFAAQALQALADAGENIALVLTQPDRPAGRGLKLQASAVKHLALDHGWPLAQPSSLKLDGRAPLEAAAAREAIAAADADVMVVAAYGLLLPPWVLQLMSPLPAGARSPGAPATGAPRLGCLNIHASLLPRWRGAAPIHRAIEAGDAHSGVTIMQMDAGLDTGDMLLVESLPVQLHGPEADTTSSLHDRLCTLGARLIVKALSIGALGQLRPTPQPAVGITYAHKIDKQEAQIDWNQTAEQLARRIRAFNPAPGATTTVAGETIKVWHAHEPHEPAQAQPLVADAAAAMAPGTVLGLHSDGLRVATGDGEICLTQLQRTGGKRQPVQDLLRGWPLPPGTRLGLPSPANGS